MLVRFNLFHIFQFHSWYASKPIKTTIAVVLRRIEGKRNLRIPTPGRAAGGVVSGRQMQIETQ